MAVKYIRSTTGSDANGGTSWADAYATIGKALSVGAAGDTAYVSQAHAETSASTITWNSPGTVGNPYRIICVNDGATPPTATATGGSVTSTGATAIALGTGFAYVYGLTLSGGSGAFNGSFTANQITAAAGWTLESCGLTIGDTNTASRMIFLGAGTAAKESSVRLIGCTLTFGSTSQRITVGVGRFRMRGCSVAGTIPTTLIETVNTAGSAGMGGQVILSACDLSALGSGKNLVAPAGSNAGACTIFVRNCKLGASVAVLSGTIQGPGSTEIYLDNCDSGSGNIRMEHYKYGGSIVAETTKVKSSGASDGTTTISHKLVSLATGPSLFSPLEGPWMTAWNETLSSLTASVDFLHDSLTNLQNSDIYLEVEYLGTSGFPESVYSNNRVADVFATPADCPVSTATWTTTGITNPNKQKLQVTFTPTLKGPIRWRVCVAKSNYTVYVDPQASGLATPSREYLIPGSAYINETSAGGGAAGVAFVPNLDGV